jgi:hypothetical protein
MGLHVGTAHSPEDLQEAERFVPLPADLIAALKVAVFQRRSLGQGEAALEDLVQEAVKQWLEREIDGTARISIQL